MNHTEKKIFESVVKNDDKLVGAIFSTFNFDSEYFESILLPSLLKINLNEETEEHLQTLDLLQNLEECPIGVFIDIRANLKCERKIPNYDLYPISDSTQHSKIIILIFEKMFKVIVSSANLTKEAFHNNNKEAYVEMNFQSEDDEWSVLKDVINFFEVMLENNKYKHCKSISLALQKYYELKPESVLVRNAKFIGVSPTSFKPISFAKELKEFWNKNPMDGRKKPKIKAICIQSPFYESSVNNDKNLIIDIENDTVSLLDQKEEPFFDILIPTCNGKRSTNFPIEAYKDYENLKIWENPNQKNEKSPIRFPHLKTYYVTDWDSYSMFMIGSSNFSPSAFGYVKKSNYEANILFFKENYSTRDLKMIIPDTNEITNWEVLSDDSSVHPEENFLDPIISFATYNKKNLKICLLENVNDEFTVELGGGSLNSNFIGCNLELELEELTETNLIVKDQKSKVIQIFPITIVDGNINDALKRIPQNIISSFIEARYKRSGDLMLSDYILEQKRLEGFDANVKIEFDTSKMLMYEIREFNNITSSIYQKMLKDINYPAKVYYHLMSRFGLIECIKNYTTRNTKNSIVEIFKSLEVVTQVFLSFEKCTNAESKQILNEFYEKSQKLIEDIVVDSSLESQINIYKKQIIKLSEATLRKVADDL